MSEGEPEIKSREQGKSELTQKILDARRKGEVYTPVGEEISLYAEILADEREDDQPRFGSYSKHGRR